MTEWLIKSFKEGYKRTHINFVFLCRQLLLVKLYFVHRPTLYLDVMTKCDDRMYNDMTVQLLKLRMVENNRKTV